MALPTFMQPNYGVKQPFIGPVMNQNPQFMQPNYGFKMPSQVLPMSTQNIPGGSGGGNGIGKPVQAPPDPFGGLRNDINSGWDDYINSLDSQLGGLGQQRSAQEGIAQSQFNQGINTLDLQKNQGLQALSGQRTAATTNQQKTLRDLSENLRNSFQAGNVYLGARGAADSSAADQYSYALTKLGTKQRTDINNNTANIMNDIGSRETNLNNIYNTEKKNLQEGLNQNLAGIANWYSSAVQQLQQQKAQGRLGKAQDLQNLSKDILNQALSAINQVHQAASGQQSALEKWAQTNSQKLAEVKQQVGTISTPQYQLPQAQALAGTPQTTASGGIYTPPVGYGQDDRTRQSIFA